MTPYIHNSPQAAARLLAVILVADGNYSMSELRALEQLEAPKRLGLTAEELKDVIDQFCQDLLSASKGAWIGSTHMDESALLALFDEVQAPHLRREILSLSKGVVLADEYEADSEVSMLDAMEKAWRASLRTEDSQP